MNTIKEFLKIILLIGILLYGFYYITKTYKEDPVIIESDTLFVVIKYEITAKQILPAIIEYITVYDSLSNETVQDTVAYVEMIVDEEKVKGKIKIKYSYIKKEFEIDLNLQGETTIQTITHHVKVPRKKKIISPAIDIGYFDTEFLTFGGGIMFSEQFILLPKITTSGTWGIGITYLF